MSERKELKKILLIGLDNSGKTSIVLSLKNDTNLLSFLSLKPTTGLKVQNLESSKYDLNIWDFGGQKQYREDYLKEFHNYTQGLDKVIFVIDVQNIDRYDLALEYLENIVDLLTKDRILVELTIFLHKYDPNLSRQTGFEDIDKIMNERLVNKITSIIPSELTYEIYRTSIYTVFEQNLMLKSKNK